MKINDFKAKNESDKTKLEEKLNSFKLENVLSLWYLVSTSSKARIVGSKN